MTTVLTMIFIVIFFAIFWLINKLHVKLHETNKTYQKPKKVFSMPYDVGPQFSPIEEKPLKSRSNPVKHLDVKQEPEVPEIVKNFDIKKAIIYKEILEPKFKEY